MSTMIPLLTITSGLAWTVVYLDAIRIGFRDRTCAMPLAALALNFAWEAIYAAHDLAGPLSVQAGVNLAWALADLAIVYTYFKFGRAELPRFVTRSLHAAWGILVFATAFVVQGLFIEQFGVHEAARYSAFLQNVVMSGLFIQMLAVRRSLRGQSLTIAIAKWLGTLAPASTSRRCGTGWTWARSCRGMTPVRNRPGAMDRKASLRIEPGRRFRTG